MGRGEGYGEPSARGRIVEGDRLGVGGDPLDEAGQDAAGPDLDERVTPAAVIRSTAPTQSTPAVRCSTSSARAPSAVVIARASALARSGDVGSRNSTPARTAAHRRRPPRPSAASGRRRDTGRTIDLAGAELLGRSRRRLDRRPLAGRRRPGPARCGSRRRRRRGRRARSTSSGSRASSRPMIAAIAPSRPGPDACIRRPRSRTSRTPSASEITPAATNAEYWPIEWPAAKRGRVVDRRASAHRSRSGGQVGDRGREERRLGVLGPVEVLGRAVPGERLIGSPRAASASAKTAAAAGRGGGEGPAHPDRLRALAGEHEGVRRCIVRERTARRRRSTRAGVCAIARKSPDSAILPRHGRRTALASRRRATPPPRPRDRPPLRGRPVGAGPRRRHADPERPPDLRAGRDGPRAVARARHRLRVAARRDAPRVHPARGALRPGRLRDDDRRRPRRGHQPLAVGDEPARRRARPAPPRRAADRAGGPPPAVARC